MTTAFLTKNKSYIYILLLIWLVIFGFILFSISTIYRSKNIYLNASLIESKAQAQLLGENISNILYSVDITILSIVSKIESQNSRDIIFSKQIEEAIKTQTVFLPQINNIILFDAEKKIIHSLKPVQGFDLTSFEGHKSSWLEFSINTVVTEQNKKMIVLSRRVETMTGEFSGVLAAIIDPAFFYNRYNKYLNIDVDAIALLDAQRKRLASWHNNIDHSELQSDDDPHDCLSGLPESALEGGGINVHENFESIISTYQLSEFPFQIVVLHNKITILRQWYHETKQDLAIIIFTVFIAIITMILVFNQRKKRKKAEQKLIDYKNYLEDMVDKRTLNLKKANIELRKEIMEREQAEMALHKSEQRYKSAQQMGQVGNWEYDLATENFWASDEAKRIYGFNPESKNFTTEEVENCIPDRARVHQALIDLIEDNKPYELEFEIHPVSGPKRKFIRSIAKLQKTVSGEPYKVTGVILDITKQKEEESEKRLLLMKLQQSQKMESIGTLAGGIAHDFNNLLYPIMGFAEMLKEDLPQDSPEHEMAQEVFNAGRRGSELVKQILAFSRQSDHKLSPVRFQKILAEVCKLTRSTIPSDIEMHQDIQKDCGPVMAEATQLHQIAMNLITNAYHAVEKTSGKILVQLKEIMLDNDDLIDSSLQPGQYAMLSVCDNGAGIPEKIMNHIFEPYFTTKEQGKGTGLGLAVVYGILTEHKGDIKVYSEKGKGTTFNVYLPLMKKSDEPILTEKVLKKLTGTENILLVDDEESVVRLEKQMLERFGYNVAAQSSSVDALKMFKADPDDYDLVVTDMTMPNMTGDKLAEEILSIRSNIPVIICTGFSERINKKQAQGLGISGFLMKPVVKSELAQMVRKVLDRARTITESI